MAELGQTTDPRALIPGQPETIDADAGALGLHGKRLEQVGARLRSVTVGEWDGMAGARFAQLWAGEPPKWLKVADAVAAATAALYSYAGMLRWAQGQAAGAVTLWEQADGEVLRRQARDMLTHARDQLRAAGDQAARAISGGDIGTGIGRPTTLPGTTSGSALDTLVTALTGSASASGSFAGGGVAGQGKAGFEGLSYGIETSGPDLDVPGGELTLGEVKAHAYLFDANAAGTLSAGGLTAAGTASAGFGADMSASASITEEGLEAHLAASDGPRASAEATGAYGILGIRAGVRAAGEAFGGVQGDLGLDATPEKAGVSVEAFAGGRVAGDLGADVGGIGVGVHSEAWAGVGAKVDGGYEFKEGRFHLHGHVGAALGIGGSEGFDITVDPETVEHSTMAAAHALGRGLDGVGHGARDAVDSIGKTLRSHSHPRSE